MITIDEIKEHVARFTYKPGYRFSVIDSSHTAMNGYANPHYLTVSYLVTDSENPDLSVQVTGHEMIPPHMLEYMDLKTFDHVILTKLLRRCDQHEMEEWLRYQGKRIVDPHPKTFTQY